ncbi:MAG: hypothetical protein ACK40L_01435 [Hydrogenophaga sp.]
MPTKPFPPSQPRRQWLAAFMGATLLLLAPLSHAAPVDDAVQELQQGWEAVRYQAPEKERAQRFEALAAQARAASAAHPDRAEPLIWEGIILSSLAGEKGGLGALPLVKQAKGLYENALRIDPKALDGSAYNSLGVLYYKVPGWPIGFGDKKKASELLRQALVINPNGIDPNFFYAEYLVETERPEEALPYLDRALKAPDRPGRPLADSGRREEVKQLMAKLRGG